MKQPLPIVASFIAHGLVLAMLFPSIFQFTHIFENHKHVFCDDVETHVHEQKVGCDLDHFQVVPYIYAPPLAVTHNRHEPIIGLEIRTATAIYNSIQLIHSLRGPPKILV